ncbi:transmembrane protein 180 [Dermochelys coriacea]|uniref:transmembrane protein 180 n=1 Tax=Dermochelys coriacea TaxID=27794 RepID=UPI0018E76E0B|nr:transmembrane protein 180 [Dermochelys coriacea]XP_038267258.1 transmembrane protein 180 [Dermochelys coriacea]XP_038267259.1 transmembrane protein 180 [Dermochelys coriacea]XP_038267260.1 transmembrane protein 180 [Dermochelys coriacea]XP_038267262.1 transmembrane protein 180 [Dermochelys coriacea]XP_038267263.1 transmembrane protein 180 [Dermochelys coriacea]XP_043374650.1 transmembrane protein 180 [Dermochelys coriacea]XP_043374652.1 transmembrane protein 180 [Dermochelys coriacea]
MGLRLLGCLFNLPTAVIYGSLSLFVSILHNVFLLYYVDTFVSVYKIDKLSFWIGETVFLIWNSLNDPFFGWLSDRVFLSTQQSGVEISSPEVILKRLKALSRNGPLFAISFLAFWVSWAHPGLQFLLCLCLYDSFLTMVDLNHSALLADLAVSARDRTSLNFYCSLFSAIGSFSVFMSYAVWNKDDFFSFRIFCVALALCSVAGFALATGLLRQRFETEVKVKWDQESTLKELYIEQPSAPLEKRITLGEYLKQLSRHHNFLWFVCMNLVQVFHCHFNSNFFPLFLEHLLSDRISLSTGSFLLGISYIAPHLNNLYFLSLCQRYGVYVVVQGLFFLKLALSIIMLLAGPDQVYLLCIFIASNRVFTEGTCKLLNLVVTDLVDEDFVLNRRKQAASALLFGMVALVTKPGQTFAPLIGTWLLCTYTGYDIFQRAPLSNVVSAQPKLASNTAWEPTLRQGCFYLLVFIPITCALLQLLSWSQFSLHGRRLQTVKSQRQSLTQSRSQEIKMI